MNVLLTGSNRGIGLGLVKAILEKKAFKTVIATCRRPEEATELKEIEKAHSNVHVLKLDVTDYSAFPNFANEVGEIVGNEGLNVLINNAGIAGKFLKIGYLKHEAMLEAYSVNTVAPVMLAKAFMKLLKQGALNCKDQQVGAAVVNITSVLGSISANDTGGYYPYRCSKAALNAATKSLSIDLKPYDVLAVSIHPGWVRTELGGEKAPMSVEESTVQIVDTVSNLRPEQTGTFLNYDGKSLDW
ncbi:uncharacterized protein LOC106664859 [Cimex lectularius]|uniref:C-factor n=1 Tax=Cimex lectularius TaxID=79782 RepID=A0A8I6RMY0_CIMLE|nr:uncharacterized protein LOC106664859 [Cimex lectularius]